MPGNHAVTQVDWMPDPFTVGHQVTRIFCRRCIEWSDATFDFSKQRFICSQQSIAFSAG
jgi:hypothetical protein